MAARASARAQLGRARLAERVEVALLEAAPVLEGPEVQQAQPSVAAAASQASVAEEEPARSSVSSALRRRTGTGTGMFWTGG